MSMMQIVVTPDRVGLPDGIEENKTYLVDTESIFLNDGTAYGDVYDLNNEYIDQMPLKCFTSV